MKIYVNLYGEALSNFSIRVLAFGGIVCDLCWHDLLGHYFIASLLVLTSSAMRESVSLTRLVEEKAQLKDEVKIAVVFFFIVEVPFFRDFRWYLSVVDFAVPTACHVRLSRYFSC